MQAPHARWAAWLAFSGSRRGRTELDHRCCCVNTLIGAPALSQPQVRPAPANPTTRLE